MPNLAFGPPNTKNRALWDVPNLKKYATPLQYCLKYETLRTTIAKINIIILLRFSLSSSTNISLSVFSLCHSQTLSHFFSLCHSLSLPSPPCSRKLLKITLQSSPPISPVLAVDLAASFSTTRRRSCCLMLQPSLPTFRSLLIWLWEWDLGWVSMWVLGRHCGCEIWDGFRCWCCCCWCCCCYWLALMLLLL